MTSELLLIDLSSVLYPIWHMSGKDPDPDATSTKTVERVRALASGRSSGVAVCCDSGRTFRHEITPTYKATRPESDATRQHQMQIAMDTLRADGFPVWAVKGFESDDIIATCHLWASVQEIPVTIATDDKDLIQLIDERTRIKRLRDDSIYDYAAVVEKIGIRPDQMRDYISLVGDTSDNIVGAKGIGAVKASTLLQKFGTLDALYVELEAKGGAAIGIKPADSENLRAFKLSGAMALARQLVTLRTDVPLPCEEILAERVAKDVTDSDGVLFGHAYSGIVPEGMEVGYHDEETTRFDSKPHELPKPTVERVSSHDEGNRGEAAEGKGRPQDESPDSRGTVAVAGGTSAPTATAASAPVSLAVRDAEVLPAPVEWERQLEPRSMREAIGLADLMFRSKLFSQYGQPQGVLSTILAGRELGLQAMASLRGFFLVDGKPTLSADLIRALVIKSGKAKYFRVVERTPTIATWETQRGDDPPVRLSFTIEEAIQAGVVKKGSGWERFPSDMLTARASAKLARLVYSDIVFNLYEPGEM